VSLVLLVAGCRRGPHPVYEYEPVETRTWTADAPPPSPPTTLPSPAPSRPSPWLKGEKQ
jgi:hypothetical protein